MSMRPILHCAALLLGLSASAGALAGEEPEAFESVSLMHAVGTLVAEPDGSVSAVQLDTKVEAELRPAIERSVAGLRFKPALVGGVAQRIRTGFELSLAARPAAGGKGYEVTIDGIRFHPVKGASLMHADDEPYDVVADGRLKPPAYPREAEQNGAMGRVLLALRFSAEGKVEDVAVIGSMLYETGVMPGIARRALHRFEQAALGVARHWRGKVTPGKVPVGPKGYTTTCAVVFTLSRINLDKDGQWLAVKRLPNRPIPWAPAEDKKWLLEDAGSTGGFIALGGGGLELERSARGTPVL